MTNHRVAIKNAEGEITTGEMVEMLVEPNGTYYADEEDGEWYVFHEDTESRVYFSGHKEMCETEAKRLNVALNN